MFALKPWRENELVGYPVPRLRNEFKTLYDRLFGGLPALFEPFVEPKNFWGLEVKEAEKEFVVRAEVPGFEPNELDVELRNNRLFIKAEKKHEMGEKETGFAYTERCYERFVELPVEMDPAKVEATYRNGVLEIHLPKTETAATRHIPVK
jgi:HSP20 family protein